MHLMWRVKLFLDKNYMTTSVDILFKELPAMSRADERISRPDASSIGSDNDRDRSYISKHDDEKTFNEHLEDHDVSNERPIKNDYSDQKIPSTGHEENFNDRSNPIEEQVADKEVYNVYDNKGDEKNLKEDVNNIEGVKTVVKQNDNYTSNNEIKTEEKAPSFTTKDLMLTETTAEKSALQNNANTPQSTLKNSVNNISDQIVINKSSNGSSPDQSFDHQTDQNKPSPNNVQTNLAQKNNFEIKVVPENTDEVKLQQSEGTTKELVTNPIVNNTNNVIDKSISFTEKAPNHTLTKEATPNDINTAEATTKPSLENQKPASMNAFEIPGKAIDDAPENKTALNAKQQTTSPITNEKVSEEIGSTISAMAKSLNEEVSKVDLIQKPVPQQETVAVESTKTLPFTAIHNPTNMTKSSSNSKKTGSSVTATSGSNNATAANKAAQGAVQNSISQTMLQNAQKSDIQIDLNLGGQKFDAPLGQSMTPSGQPSLTTGSMLAAQDVSFQKALSTVSTNKTDAPMNAKMINEQITVAINKNVVKGLNNFSIRLHPAELGQVDIKLEFAADGKMHAAMMVESEKTLTMLQRDQASLEKALQDAGINLSNQEMNFSLMKQNRENNSNNFARATGSSQTDKKIDDLTELGSMQEIRMAYSNQALDISV